MEERLRGLEGRFRPRRTVVETIRDLRPDVLLWATLIHQDNEELEVVKACQIEGIKIVAAPASFDVLSSKGGFLIRPHNIWVWGEVSKQDALKLHGFEESQIHIIGPVHWESYEAFLGKGSQDQ